MTTTTETMDPIAVLEPMDPREVLKWAYENHGDRAAILTSFQDTGCVMIDMAFRAQAPLRVVTVDTLRLHPETYELMERIEEKYGIRIERFKPDPEKLQRMIDQHGEYLFFDSKLKQEYCCKVRKVEPNDEALKTLDVWITGLRRDQSEFRKDTQKASWVDAPGHGRPGVSRRKVLKIAPLVEWTEEEVRAYIKEHDVPYNPLYDQGYTSIGCIICSTPTKPWEDKRAGRWRWFNSTEDDDKKECGIHLGGSGI